MKNAEKRRSCLGLMVVHACHRDEHLELSHVGLRWGVCFRELYVCVWSGGARLFALPTQELSHIFWRSPVHRHLSKVAPKWHASFPHKPLCMLQRAHVSRSNDCLFEQKLWNAVGFNREPAWTVRRRSGCRQLGFLPPVGLGAREPALWNPTCDCHFETESY